MTIMQTDQPDDAPPGTIQIDPDEGFGPHLAQSFLDWYGEDSVFAAATADCLTWRFVKVLVRAGKLPAEHQPHVYGSPELCEALEALLDALSTRGLEKASVLLLQSAVGRADAHAFQTAAGYVLGNDLIQRWLVLLEQADPAGATALLTLH